MMRNFLGGNSNALGMAAGLVEEMMNSKDTLQFKCLSIAQSARDVEELCLTLSFLHDMLD